MNKPLTPIKAIRARCLDCCAGQPQEVRYCTIPDCSLYPYRMGKRPKNEGQEQTTDNSASKAAELKKREIAHSFSARNGMPEQEGR